MINRKKTSIDFTNESTVLLEKSKNNLQKVSKKKISNSYIVNDLIQSVFGMDNQDVIKSLNSLILHYKQLTKNEKNLFLLSEYKKNIDKLERIIFLFNSYKKEISQNPKMRTIHLKGNRSINFPSDWIVVNPKSRSQATECYVMECKDSQKTEIPHFLYLGHEDDIINNKYTEEFIRNFHSDVLSVFPDFQIIIDTQIEPIFVDGKIVNESECSKSSHIGIYKIINSNELKGVRRFNSNYQIPYGAVVNIE